MHCNFAIYLKFKFYLNKYNAEFQKLINFRRIRKHLNYLFGLIQGYYFGNINQY